MKPEPSPLSLPLRSGRRKIFLKGLTVDAAIGAYDHERRARQPVRIDLSAEVMEPRDPSSDRLEDVVCYNRLAEGIRAIIAEGHIRLAETLAERIAALALSHPMVLGVVVRVEKPCAIEDAEAAGVEITRTKPD